MFQADESDRFRPLLRHSREGGNPLPLPFRLRTNCWRVWIPAFAGMTDNRFTPTPPTPCRR
ncbi:hypothetical protein CA237_03065 [Sphingomonas sp. ABOLH]|nr:MAG: hypothetical protein DI625_09130 [Sphingomonas sp.]RSV32442.1 hypothetical protein CA237_03065 [Sphingomonas sp. ABOLH]